MYFVAPFSYGSWWLWFAMVSQWQWFWCDCFLLQPNGSVFNDGHGLVTIRMKPDSQGRFGFNVKVSIIIICGLGWYWLIIAIQSNKLLCHTHRRLDLLKTCFCSLFPRAKLSPEMLPGWLLWVLRLVSKCRSMRCTYNTNMHANKYDCQEIVQASV